MRGKTKLEKDFNKLAKSMVIDQPLQQRTLIKMMSCRRH